MIDWCWLGTLSTHLIAVNSLRGRYYFYTHFPVGEAEDQRGQVSFLRLLVKARIGPICNLGDYAYSCCIFLPPVASVSPFT